MCLPTYFAKGNIPYIKRKQLLFFYIATDKKTKHFLQNQKSVKQLQKICPLFFDVYEAEEFKENTYVTMTKMHNNFVIKCHENDIIIFLNPDSLLSSNYFKGLVTNLDEQTDAILIHNFRINLEKSFFKLEKMKSKNNVLTLNEKFLVSFGLKYIHNSSKCIFWDQNRCGFASWHICLQIDHDNFISSMFHPHPAIIKIKNPSFLIEGTIDHNFVMNVTRGEKYFKVLNSSNSGFALEISSEQYNPYAKDTYEQIVFNPEPIEIIPWMLNWTKKHHRNYAKTICQFFGESNLNKSSLKKLKLKKQELSFFIAKINQIYEQVSGSIQCPENFKLLKSTVNLNKKIKIFAENFYSNEINKFLESYDHKFSTKQINNFIKRINNALQCGINIEKSERKKLYNCLLNIENNLTEVNIKQTLFPEKNLFGILKMIINKI